MDKGNNTAMKPGVKHPLKEGLSPEQFVRQLEFEGDARIEVDHQAGKLKFIPLTQRGTDMLQELEQHLAERGVGGVWE